MSKIENINEILKQNNGILKASDLAKKQIPRTYLSILEKSGAIEKVSRGIYIIKDSFEDEMYCLQSRFKRAIFSHDTALFLHDLSDRSPLAYCVTVPAGYNGTSLKENRYKAFYVKLDLFELGIITMKSPNGNDLKVYNVERTIRDILRNRNQLDIQIVNNAMKRYARLQQKDLHLLYSYAKQFRLNNIVRQYMEILL